jgi:DNA mismatch repair ATPase MutS
MMTDAEPTPWTLERLRVLLRDLRDAQRTYWRQHRRASYADDQQNLRKAIEAERKADDALKELDARLPLSDRESPPAPPGD